MADAPSPSDTPPASPPPTGGRTPAVVEDEKVLATVAYILTWLTGLIIILVAKKDQRYARWNAVQAIALGVVASVLAVALNILSVMFIFAGGTGYLLFSTLSSLLGLATLVLVILCAIKAYQGSPFRIPVLAGYADKYA